MTPAELEAAVRAAVQAILDAAGDGWQIAQFVISMGIERVAAGGEIESAPWLWSPPNQPDWMTDGLIESAFTLRLECGEFDDDDR